MDPNIEPSAVVIVGDGRQQGWFDNNGVPIARAVTDHPPLIPRATPASPSSSSQSRGTFYFTIIVFLAVLGGGIGAAVYFLVIRPQNTAGSLASTGGGTTHHPTTTSAQVPTTPIPTVAPSPRPATAVPTAPTPPTMATGYGINFVYATPAPTEVQNILNQARQRWSSIIADPGPGTRPPVGTKLCDTDVKIYNGIEVVNDMDLLVNITTMDGIGGILGSGGPCGLVASGTFRSVTGQLNFDVDDFTYMINNGEETKVLYIVTHEMCHAFGFGSYWGPDNANLAPEVPGSLYTGAGGIQGHVDVGGSGKPEVEDSGGPATAYSHWKKSVFGEELMTGYLDSVAYLSKMSIESLRDLGYTVDASLADSYTEPTPSGRLLRGKDAINLGDDVIRPKYIIELEPLEEVTS